MSKLRTEATLFGLDLRQVGAHIRVAWRQISQWPWIRRCLPATEVVWCESHGRMHMARLSGDQCLSLTPHALPEAATVALKQGARAVCVDSAQVLERLLVMPQMPLNALEGAVRLDVQTSSPFASEDTAWAFRILPAGQAGPATTWRVVLAMASKATVQVAVRRDSSLQTPEVWLQTSHGPVMLRGYAEQARLRKERQTVASWGVAAMVVLGVWMGVLITPVVQLRQQAHDATRQYEALHQATIEQQEQRQAVLQGVQDLAALQPVFRSQIHPASVWQALTQLLPEDTSLEMLHLQGDVLRIRGLSDNAAAVVQRLSSTPGFKEVRMPSAVTRMQMISKEIFVIEAKMDPQIFGVYRQPRDSAAARQTEVKP